MEDIVDLIATDASASDISDKIKDTLYAKSAGRIDGMKPTVANTVLQNPKHRKNQLNRNKKNETDHRRDFSGKNYIRR